MHQRFSLLTVLVLAAALFGAAIAGAQTTPDQLGLSVVTAGHGKVRLTVTAGPSGAPNGFEVWWMTSTEFASYGGIWPPPWVQGEGWVDYTGLGTLHTWGANQVDFRLTPNQSLDIEIGDTYDETGVSGNAKSIQSELDGATDYVFCAYAYGSTPGTGSPLSVTLDRATTAQGSNCTFTQGYWKNHPDQWPVSSLTLGTGPGVSYTVAELLQIFNEPVNSNGLVALAHQLIAAKLNIANGANPTAISATIANDDAMIGNLVVPPIGGGSLPTSQTSNDTQTLDDWNSGITGPGHCGETPAHNPTWGALKAKYR